MTECSRSSQIACTVISVHTTCMQKSNSIHEITHTTSNVEFYKTAFPELRFYAHKVLCTVHKLTYMFVHNNFCACKLVMVHNTNVAGHSCLQVTLIFADFFLTFLCYFNFDLLCKF